MSEWNPDLYLKFKNERTQPALDRVNRIRHLPPDKAADLRCGPGSSTAVLRDAFPSAQLIEIDSSELMIRQARENIRSLHFAMTMPEIWTAASCFISGDSSLPR